MTDIHGEVIGQCKCGGVVSPDHKCWYVPVAPAPTASAKVFAMQEIYDDFLEQYTTPKDCGVLPPDVCWTWVEAWAKFYASSQSSKLEGVGQEAAEKIVRTFLPPIKNDTQAYEIGVAAWSKWIAAIIDELIAGRLEP